MLKYLRLGLIFIWEFFVSYLGVIIPNLIFRKRLSLAYRYRTLRKIIHRLARHLRIELHIENGAIASQKGPFFIVCNHHSMLDPLLMIHLFQEPVRFISKKEVRKLLVFGDATASIDTVFINRQSVRSQISQMQMIKSSLMQKQSHWLAFPEATRNLQYSQPFLPFKAGTFKQAMEAKATILPLVTYGVFRPLDPKLHWQKYPIFVTFLPPIHPQEYEGQSTIEFSEAVRLKMQQASDKMIKKDQAMRRKTP